MGKYSAASRRPPPPPKPEGPHAVWRGIGCLMALIVPVISSALAVETVKYGIKARWPIPYQLLGTPLLPEFFYKSDGLVQVFGPLTHIPNLYAYTVAGLLYILLLGGLLSLVYAIMYRFVGPTRYGPTDAPPPKIKTKRYVR